MARAFRDTLSDWEWAELQVRLRAMVREGRSASSIASELGVADRTIFRWKRELGIPRAEQA